MECVSIFAPLELTGLLPYTVSCLILKSHRQNITATDVWYCYERYTFAMANPRWDTTYPAIPRPISFLVFNTIWLTYAVAVCVLSLSGTDIWLLPHCTPRATNSMWQRISVQGLYLSNGWTNASTLLVLGRREGFDSSQLLELLMCTEATGWTLDLNLSPSHNSRHLRPRDLGKKEVSNSRHHQNYNNTWQTVSNCLEAPKLQAPHLPLQQRFSQPHFTNILLTVKWFSREKLMKHEVFPDLQFCLMEW